MFYLIGGAPRSGKTTIAKELSNKLSIPWISTDTLESVVVKYINSDNIEKLFPKSVLRKLTNNSNDEMYIKYTSNEIVDAYIEQGKSMAQAIETFIACEALYNHDYILEGHHISPDLVLILKDKFPIKAVFVGREDIEETLKAITINPHENDWVTSKTKNTETYTLIANMLTEFSLRVKKSAEENNLQYVSVATNFKDVVEQIVGNINKEDK